MKVPAGLGPAGAKYWRTVTRGWRLDAHQPAILLEACRCLDLAAAAEKDIAEHGAVEVDRFGQRKQSPSVATLRDMRTLFARLVRELNLSTAPTEGPRPPVLPGRYAGRP